MMDPNLNNKTVNSKKSEVEEGAALKDEDKKKKARLRRRGPYRKALSD